MDRIAEHISQVSRKTKAAHKAANHHELNNIVHVAGLFLSDGSVALELHDSPPFATRNGLRNYSSSSGFRKRMNSLKIKYPMIAPATLVTTSVMSACPSLDSICTVSIIVVQIMPRITA